MKTSKILFFLFFFSLLLLVSSCVKHYNKIEIPSEKIEKVEYAMRFVRNSLCKSVFDTLGVKKYRLECEIDTEVQYAISENPNRDSIEQVVKSNFDFSVWLPFSKSIYQASDGSIVLNERQIGKNVTEFKKNALNCKELHPLSAQERMKFVDSFVLMLENDVCGCFEIYSGFGVRKYSFNYSRDRIYYNRWSERFLYLKEDNPNTAAYILLDQKGGLLLYKNKNDDIPH